MKLNLLLTLLLAASLPLHAETAAPAKPKPPAPPVEGVTPPEGANLATFPVLHPGTIGAHNKFNEISKQGKAELVFLGDSITAGWSGKGKDVWAKYYGSMGDKVANFGIGGDRTEHVLWRLDHGNFDAGPGIPNTANL